MNRVEDYKKYRFDGTAVAIALARAPTKDRREVIMVLATLRRLRACGPRVSRLAGARSVREMYRLASAEDLIWLADETVRDVPVSFFEKFNRLYYGRRHNTVAETRQLLTLRFMVKHTKLRILWLDDRYVYGRASRHAVEASRRLY